MQRPRVLSNFLRDLHRQGPKMKRTIALTLRLHHRKHVVVKLVANFVRQLVVLLVKLLQPVSVSGSNVSGRALHRILFFAPQPKIAVERRTTASTPSHLGEIALSLAVAVVTHALCHFGPWA